MITFTTAKRLADISAAQAKRVETNARKREAIARGTLSSNMAHTEALETYWKILIPALQALADAGDEKALAAALDEADRDAPK